MSTILFLSPHLDDVVFSCAGAVIKAVAAGQKVVIATVFSHGRNHESRRMEDRKATQFLGARAMWLGFTDAPDRSTTYSDFESIIFGAANEEASLHMDIAQRLKELMEQLQPVTLYAPLGVGTHIDHRMCYAATQGIQTDKGIDIWFYEERPYSYAPGAVELRLHELGFQVSPVQVSQLLAGFRRLPHVRAYLPAGKLRTRCEGLLVAPLAKTATWVSPSHQTTPCSKESTIAAHLAAELYGSQFEAFCGSRESLRHYDARHAQRLGLRVPRAERYWQITPTSPILPP